MSENDCVFCKIVRGEMLHDEEEVLAFEDISQKALVHVLVVPKHKEHVFSMAEMGELSDAVAKRLIEVAQRVAEWMGVPESGYAFRVDTGPDAGQEVFHLCSHMMGGKRLGMP
jgi:histidine triad (HIT) family protein